jgi:hypothetical protein
MNNNNLKKEHKQQQMLVSVENRVGGPYEDISTVVLNILQAEIGTAPAAEVGVE